MGSLVCAALSLAFAPGPPREAPSGWKGDSLAAALTTVIIESAAPAYPQVPGSGPGGGPGAVQGSGPDHTL